MNKFIAFLIITILLTNCSKHKDTSRHRNILDGSVSISGAFALYPLVVKWSEEFRKLHPEVKIDVSAGGSGKGITDVLSNMVDIGMVSRELNPAECSKGGYAVAVVKDAVVATMSASNPQLTSIISHGMTEEIALGIWGTGKYKTWGEAFNLNLTAPLHIYTRSDAAGAAECWARYIGIKQEDLSGVGVFGDPGLAQAIIKDPLGIGYNNLAYVFDMQTRHVNAGLQIIPIDLNKNGTIDPEEKIYDNLDTFIKAVSNGTYPSPPGRNLYFVFNNKPSRKVVVEFIRWILITGQTYVNSSGYVALPKEVLGVEIQKLK